MELLHLFHSGPQAGTAATIFAKMDEVLQSNAIPWAKYVGISVDNTSVNLGRSNSIRTRVQQQNPNAYFMGFPCNIVHNMSMKASKQFTKVSYHTVKRIVVLKCCYNRIIRSPSLTLRKYWLTITSTLTKVLSVRMSYTSTVFSVTMSTGKS